MGSHEACIPLYVGRMLAPTLASAATLNKLYKRSGLSFSLYKMETLTPTSKGGWSIQ